MGQEVTQSCWEIKITPLQELTLQEPSNTHKPDRAPARSFKARRRGREGGKAGTAPGAGEAKDALRRPPRLLSARRAPFHRQPQSAAAGPAPGGVAWSFPPPAPQRQRGLGAPSRGGLWGGGAPSQRAERERGGASRLRAPPEGLPGSSEATGSHPPPPVREPEGSRGSAARGRYLSAAGSGG